MVVPPVLPKCKIFTGNMHSGCPIPKGTGSSGDFFVPFQELRANVSGALLNAYSDSDSEKDTPTSSLLVASLCHLVPLKYSTSPLSYISPSYSA